MGSSTKIAIDWAITTLTNNFTIMSYAESFLATAVHKANVLAAKTDLLLALVGLLDAVTLI